MMRRRLTYTALLTLAVGLTFAQTPRVMNYQGKLTDHSGVGINDTTDSGCGCTGRTIAFFISDADSNTLWADTLCVKIIHGLFDAKLDLTVNGGDTLKFDEPYYIQLMVDSDDDGIPDELLSPREKLATVSFSFRSIYADTAEHYKVHHDATLTGNGTEDSPLHAVGDNWGSQVVVHDGTLAGDGTSAAPLSVLSGGAEPTSPGQWKQQLMFWEAFLRCQGCADLIPDWSDTIARNVWIRAIGGGGYDYTFSIVQANDGGFVTVGYTQSFGTGNNDILITKLDPTGNMQWARTLGGSEAELGYYITKTTDNCYVITGYTTSYGAGYSDLFIAKLDSIGGLIWFKTVGGTNNDNGYCVIQTSDGGFVVSGQTQSFSIGGSDIFVVKFNSSGDVEWAKTIGGSSSDYGWAISQTSDGGYIIAGYTNSFGAGGYEAMLVKLSSTGSLQWAKTAGTSYSEYIYSLIQTSDGYVIAGYGSGYPGTGNDGVIMKFATDGTFNWAKTLYTDSTEAIYSITPTSDGGFAVAGYSTVTPGATRNDVMLVKFTPGGNIEWARTVGDTSYDNGRALIQTDDGSFIVVGSTQSYGVGNYESFMVKFTPDGYTCDENNIFPALNTLAALTSSPSPTVTSPSVSSVDQTPYVPTCTPTVTKICTK